MCYSALIKRNLSDLEGRFGAVAIRQDFEDYEQASRVDRKRFPPLNDRIFPGHYAPVLFQHEGKLVIEVMRYGVYPPFFVNEPSRYTTFNARRDNLTSSFWSEAYGHHHGFLVLHGFYEWVKVADLLRAGVVGIDDVKEEFARQSELRRASLAKKGKPYRPTATEKRDPRFRSIIIEFRPQEIEDVCVPVIFSYRKLPGGRLDKGFAIVTDDPPNDVAAAGHDRCPIFLTDEALSIWMTPLKRSLRELDQALDDRMSLHLQHALAKSA